MKIISNKSMLQIIMRALNHVDDRLMGHGERVGYIMFQVLRKQAKRDIRDIIGLSILGVLHDVGAYKTEDIDQMVEFETNTIWEHSVYGYLFLKRFSPLAPYADAVLYHHLPYEDFDKVFFSLPENREYAALLHLADRIELVHKNAGPDFCVQYLQKHAGTRFAPKWVAAFLEADREYSILEKLVDGTYETEFEDLLDDSPFSLEQQKQFLRMIAYSIDFRSEYMVLHTVTTVSVSKILCRMMALDETESAKVYYGALLHDLGKISTPIEILEKPGRLTPEEMKIMRQHVVVTGEILGDFIDPSIRNIAVHHHEKLDGSGYPEGLTEEQLSAGDRIVAIADIISALIRKRSYKQAFDKKMTIQILTTMKDDHKICPVLTEKILKNFDSILEESEDSGREILQLYENMKVEYGEILRSIPRELLEKR